eukprot:Nk52_evm3s2297 gene=Nk52_evmTU3s2297
MNRGRGQGGPSPQKGGTPGGKHFKLVLGGPSASISGEVPEGGKKYNVMKFVSRRQGKNICFKDFAPPVRLYRGHKLFYQNQFNSHKWKKKKEAENKKQIEAAVASGVDREEAEAQVQAQIEAARSKKKKIIMDGDWIFNKKKKQWFKTRKTDQESLDWYLEDEDSVVSRCASGKDVSHAVSTAGNCYVGRKEGGIGSNYAVLVCRNEGEFELLPVNKWYNFNSKLTYNTLSLEEAESHLKETNKTVDRWMMKMRKNPNEEKDKEEGGIAKATTMITKKGNPTTAQMAAGGASSLAANKVKKEKSRKSVYDNDDGGEEDDFHDMEEVEFEMEFDDDGEEDRLGKAKVMNADGDLEEEEEEEAPEAIKNIKKEIKTTVGGETAFGEGDSDTSEDEEKLDSEGEAMQKLLNMDDDDIMEHAAARHQGAGENGQGKNGKPIVVSFDDDDDDDFDEDEEEDEEPQAAAPVAETKSSKKRGRDASGDSSGSKKAKTSSGDAKPVLTADMLRNQLKQKPLTTNELIAHFKHCFKTAEDKKRFSELVKQVATLEKIDGKNFLILKK